LEYRRVLDKATTPEHRKQIEREYDEKYYGIDAEPHDPDDDRVMMAGDL